MLDYLEEETEFLGTAHNQAKMAQLRGPPRVAPPPPHAAQATRPTGRGSPRAQAKLTENTPNYTKNNPRPELLFLLSAPLH
jgi:hypothetical protein